MVHLPPRLVRRRIDVHVGDFFRWLQEQYAASGWAFGKWDTGDDRWDARDISVVIDYADDDGRPRELLVTLRNLPGVLERNDAGEPVIGWEHAFVIVLPDGYPGDLRMKIVNRTPTVHPRMMPPDKEAPACIFPNAELDRVLREVIYNVLLKPDFVRPPVLFTGADHGYRPREMKWYAEYGPQRLYDYLCHLRDQRQRELAGQPPADGPPAAAPPPPQPSPEPPSAAPPPASPFRIRGPDDTPQLPRNHPPTDPSPPFRIR